MAKINIKTLKKSEELGCYVADINELWGDKEIETTIDFVDGIGNKIKVKRLLPLIEEKLEFIDNNKKWIVETIIEENILSEMDESKYSFIEKPFKPKKNADFLSQLEKYVRTKLKKKMIDKKTYYLDVNNERITLPISEKDFFDSLKISDIEMNLYSMGAEYDIEVAFKIRAIPDYFAEHYLEIILDSENELNILDLASDDNLEGPSLFDDEFDTDLDEEFIKTYIEDIHSKILIFEFIKAINKRNIKKIDSLLDRNFICIDQALQERNKADMKKYFENIFKSYSNYQIEVVDNGLGESERFYFSLLIKGIYGDLKDKTKMFFEKKAAIYIFGIENDKIKSLEIYEKSRLPMRDEMIEYKD